MTRDRYSELEKRSKGDLHQLAFEIFCDEKQIITKEYFDQLFPMWLGMFGNKSLAQCIEYFKKHKLK